MRNHFDAGELKSAISALQARTQIKKFASAAGEQGPVEQAMDTIARVTEYLDERGLTDAVDEISTATAALLTAIRKTAEEKEEESMFEVDCPYCEKSFKVVVELEDVETEVEESEDEPGEHPVAEEAATELETQEGAEKE